MDTPVKNERPHEVHTPKIRSGTGMQSRKASEREHDPMIA